MPDKRQCHSELVHHFCISFQKSASDICCCCCCCVPGVGRLETGPPVTASSLSLILLSVSLLTACCLIACSAALFNESALLLDPVGTFPEFDRLVSLAASASRLCCCCSLAHSTSRLEAVGPLALPAPAFTLCWGKHFGTKGNSAVTGSRIKSDKQQRRGVVL